VSSGYFVGPRGATESFELVALLAARGDDEVWHARHVPSGADVIVTSYADTADAPSLPPPSSVTGMTRVFASFAGPARHHAGAVADAAAPTHRYVVIDFVAGETLGQWLANHPDATFDQRVGLLRNVASAVDALHSGHATGRPAAHGDISPDTIIVLPDASAVLVDPLTARVVGAAQPSVFDAPESPTASVVGDAYAFAATAAHALSGRALPAGADGRLDVAALDQALRRSRLMRRRPLVRRQLTAALTAPAAHRPRPLALWLDRPRRRGQGVAVSAVVALLLMTGIGIAISPTTHHSPVASPTSPNLAVDATQVIASTSSSVVRTDGEAGLTIQATTGLGSSCDDSLLAAGTGDFPSDPFTYSGMSARLAANNTAGTWAHSTISGNLTTSGSDTIEVLGFEARYANRALGLPDWIYQSESDRYSDGTFRASNGCSDGGAQGLAEGLGGRAAAVAPATYQYAFDAALDNGPHLTPAAGSANPNTPLRLSGGASVSVVVNGLACAGNYAWQVIVHYLLPSSSQVHTAVVGVAHVYGRADQATLYQGYQGRDGAHDTVHHSLFSGSDESCAGESGVTDANPFPPAVTAPGVTTPAGTSSSRTSIRPRTSSKVSSSSPKPSTSSTHTGPPSSWPPPSSSTPPPTTTTPPPWG
jgi:hypothetical protein